MIFDGLGRNVVALAALKDLYWIEASGAGAVVGTKFGFDAVILASFEERDESFHDVGCVRWWKEV